MPATGFCTTCRSAWGAAPESGLLQGLRPCLLYAAAGHSGPHGRRGCVFCAGAALLTLWSHGGRSTQVTKVVPTAARLKILCLGDKPLDVDFTGVIRWALPSA